LVGATATPSGRNYVTNAEGQTLGFTISSSRTPPAGLSVLDGGILRHQTGGSGERLNITVQGTGSGGAAQAGLPAKDGTVYRIAFNATDNAGVPMASLVFRVNDANVAPVTSVNGSFSYEFTYTEATALPNDGTHGRVAIGIVTGAATGAVASAPAVFPRSNGSRIRPSRLFSR
jgi:hypothetical protein